MIVESKHSRDGGVDVVLRELGLAETSRFEDAFAQLALICDEPALVLRAPLDRLRLIASLSCTGSKNGRRYGVTCDIDLEDDDLVAEVSELVARFRWAIEFEDPEALIESGRDLVPYRRKPASKEA